MPEGLDINFVGPYSWPGAPGAPSLFEAYVPERACIYLWTVQLSDGHLVYYVGETGRSPQVRMLEHYTQHAACLYHLYEPDQFARGNKVLLWPGKYDPSNRKTPRECIEQYSRLSAAAFELTKTYRFLFAFVDCDGRIRRRVESAIAAILRSTPGMIGSFQDDGIRYEPRWDSESPMECHISSDVHILGLPDTLLV